MAKIAGRKNDGAWFRFNKWIAKQPEATQAAFGALLVNTETLGTAFAVVQDYIGKVGVQPSAFPVSQQAWSLELSIGIPRQLWDGVTTYDYYSKGATGEYKKLMQEAIFKLSVDIRLIAKQIRFGETEVHGLAGLTHPKPKVAGFLREPGETKYEYKARMLARVTAYWNANEAELMANAKKRLTRRADDSKGTVLRPRKPQPMSRAQPSQASA